MTFDVLSSGSPARLAKLRREAARLGNGKTWILRGDDERFLRMVDAESLVESRESDIRTAWEDYRAAWSGFLTDPRHASAARRARECVRELLQNLRDDRREYAEARAAYERSE